MTDSTTKPEHTVGAAPLRMLVRPTAVLMPMDSVARAVRVMAETRLTSLPVVDGRGRVQGIVYERRLRHLVSRHDVWDALNSPATAHAAPATTVLGDDASARDALEAMQAADAETVYVVDSRGVLLGAVDWHEIVDPSPARRRPLSAGGMATPWGVYLTTDGVQAGQSNLRLALGGVVLGLMISAAYLLVGLGCFATDAWAGTQMLDLWNRATPPAAPSIAAGWIGLQALIGVVFLGLLRASPLPRYHGAEHQVVHALERCEPLVPEVVMRMPRVHVRCGTNLIAAVAVFAALAQAFSSLRPLGIDATVGSILGAAITVGSWRRLGAWLQDHFTTRPARPHEIARAVSAAEELLARRAGQVGPVMTPLRRIWTMGAPQTASGVFVGAGLPLYITEILLRAWQP